MSTTTNSPFLAPGAAFRELLIDVLSCFFFGFHEVILHL